MYSANTKYPIKKVCSKCNTLLQEINAFEGDEVITSFEPLWYQVDLFYVCLNCWNKKEKK